MFVPGRPRDHFKGRIYVRKPYPAPPLNPLNPNGIRHANLLNTANLNKPVDTNPYIDPATGKPWATQVPRRRVVLTEKQRMRENFKKSIASGLRAPELVAAEQSKATRNPQTPTPSAKLKMPGGLSLSTIDVDDADARQSSPPQFGREAAEEIIAQLKKMGLTAEARRVIEVYNVIDFQGQTRALYHDNEEALDKTAELQPLRDRYRALEAAHLAKREKLFGDELREAEERARAEEERLAKEAEEKKKKEEERLAKEAEEKKKKEERVKKEMEELRRRRMEEARRAEQERHRREQEWLARQREAEREARLRQERLNLERIQRIERERKLQLAREELDRVRQLRDEARQNKKLYSDLASHIRSQEARMPVDLRQPEHVVESRIATLLHAWQAAEAYLLDSPLLFNVLKRIVTAEDRQDWAGAQNSRLSLELQRQEYTTIEKAYLESKPPAARVAQEQALLDERRASYEAQIRAQEEAREREAQAAREAAENKERAARKAAERAAKAELEAAKAAWKTAFCQEYERRWTVLKTTKNIGPVVPYIEFPIPVFPLCVTNPENPWVASPLPGEITEARVREFVFSEYRVGLKAKTPKEIVKAEMLRWHPDKFDGQILPLMHPNDREQMREAVGVLARIMMVIKEGV